MQQYEFLLDCCIDTMRLATTTDCFDDIKTMEERIKNMSKDISDILRYMDILETKKYEHKSSLDGQKTIFEIRNKDFGGRYLHFNFSKLTVPENVCKVFHCKSTGNPWANIQR